MSVHCSYPLQIRRQLIESDFLHELPWEVHTAYDVLVDNLYFMGDRSF